MALPWSAALVGPLERERTPMPSAVVIIAFSISALWWPPFGRCAGVAHVARMNEIVTSVPWWKMAPTGASSRRV